PHRGACGTAQAWAPAMNAMASPTVARFLTSSSGMVTEKRSSAWVTIVIIDSESMSRSSVKDFSAVTESAGRPVSSATISARPVAISGSVCAMGVLLGLMVRVVGRTEGLWDGAGRSGKDDDLGGVDEASAEPDLQG